MREKREIPPVLFLMFNREDTARKSFAYIRAVRPSQLFLAADGPRTERAGEAAVCQRVREVVLSMVDWPCEVKTLFREHNRGCREAIIEALDWFFESVERGIVIEDDCLVAPSFFPFCAELLERYCEDEHVMQISANSFVPFGLVGNDSYYFSKYQHSWGWASWRRAWRRFSGTLAAWPAYREAHGLAAWSEGVSLFERHYGKIFDALSAGKGEAWDFQWLLTGWMWNMLSITPAVNLSCNVGMGAAATHTTDEENWAQQLEAREMVFPLRHPTGGVIRNVDADRWIDVHLWHIRRGQRLILWCSRIQILRVLYHRVYMPILRKVQGRAARR